MCRFPSTCCRRLLFPFVPFRPSILLRIGTAPAAVRWGQGALDFSFQAWVSYWEHCDFPAVRRTNGSATVNVFSRDAAARLRFVSKRLPELTQRWWWWWWCWERCVLFTQIVWMFNICFCCAPLQKMNENWTLHWYCLHILILHFTVYVLSGRICRSAESPVHSLWLKQASKSSRLRLGQFPPQC